MCMFCAAVPMTLALGARAHAKHIERRKVAEARGEPLPTFINAPVLEKATATVVVGLVVAAIVNHATIAPSTGESIAGL